MTLGARKNLQLDNFQTLNWWLEKFCRRHSITFNVIYDELEDVKIVDTEVWKINLPFILGDRNRPVLP